MTFLTKTTMCLKKNRNYLLGLVLCIMLGLSLISATTLYQKSTICQISEQEPTNVDEIIYVNSADNKARVGLSGFIKYEPVPRLPFDPTLPKPRYMQLKLHQVEQNSSVGSLSLRLTTSCAFFAIVFSDHSFEKNNKQQHLLFVPINIVDPDFGVMECVGSDRPMNWEKGYHYRCDKPQEYYCVSKEPIEQQKYVAYLTLNHLEFELNGNQSKIARGQFSTNTHYCEPRRFMFDIIL